MLSIPSFLVLGTVAVGAPIPELDQIMADPDWVARSPWWPGWSTDSRTVWFHRERTDSDEWDWWTVPASGGDAVRMGQTSREQALAPMGETRADGRYRVTTVQGAVWIVDRRGNARPITPPGIHAMAPRFLTDDRVAWRQHHTWHAASLDGAELAALVTLETGDDPGDDQPEGFLEEQQQRLFPSLARARAEEHE